MKLAAAESRMADIKAKATNSPIAAAAAAYHEGERQRDDFGVLAVVLTKANYWRRNSDFGRDRLIAVWKSLQAWLKREKLSPRPPLDLRPPLPEPPPPSQLQVFELSPDASPPRLTAGRLVGCLAAPHGPTVAAVAAAA